MNIHKNARLTPLRREEMALSVIEGAFSKAHAARVYGVSAKIVARWVERYKAEGRAGMIDRSSRPAHMPRATAASIAERIVALRRQRWTGKHIAHEVGVSPATVSRVLKRAGLSRLSDIEPAEPVRRYEREHPGEMIHIDIKKLGRFSQIGHRITGDPQKGKSRGAGWEFVHVCIDDASRIAFSQILPDEKKESAIAFLKAAVAYYASLGVAIARVMTDNGSCYRRPSPGPAAIWASSTSRQGPIRPRPTARPSASSRQHCENGPMPSISDFRSPCRRVAGLAASLQLAPSTRQPKVQNTNQSPRSNRGQPVEAPHLVGSRVRSTQASAA